MGYQDELIDDCVRLPYPHRISVLFFILVFIPKLWGQFHQPFQHSLNFSQFLGDLEDMGV